MLGYPGFHSFSICIISLTLKKAGVKTAEPVREARGKCPGLIVVPPDYQLYLRFSAEARRIYNQYTDRVEAFGIDESWLDVTGSAGIFGGGEKIAHEIRCRIKEELGVTVSIGVSRQEARGACAIAAG